MATAIQDRGTQITVAVLKRYTTELRSDTSVDMLALDLTTATSSYTSTTALQEEDLNMSTEEVLSPPMSPQHHQAINVETMMLANMSFYGNDEHLTQHEKDLAKEVARKLVEMGDELNTTLKDHDVWSQLFSALSNRDQSLQQQIKESFQGLRAKITTKNIVKVFYLGFRILSSADTTNQQLPEHTQLVENVMEILIEQVTLWIQEQGGWSQWPEVLQFPEPQEDEQEEENPPVFSSRNSTPTLLHHDLLSRAASTPPPRQRGTTIIRGGLRSQSFSYSRAIPIRRDITQSYPTMSGSYPHSHCTEGMSPSLSRRSSSLSSSLVLMSAGALTIALASYLQS